MNKKQLSINIVKKWLGDYDWRVRVVAMKICPVQGIPFDTIKKWLNDDCCYVRKAAMQYAKNNNLDIENIYVPYRTIEPPRRVYKKCMGDVIVVATIPDDAEVRGGYHTKCRTNKAKIIDIIGTFNGEKVGVSRYNMTTTYFIGDEIYIDDFDLSEDECSTGFHFFCDIEQAKNYKF